MARAILSFTNVMYYKKIFLKINESIIYIYKYVGFKIGIDGNY